MSDSQAFPHTSAFISQSQDQNYMSFQAHPDVEIDGRFRLIKQIGEGGMGVVYLAKQLNVNRDVVIKLLKPHLCYSEEQVERFRREAQLSSQLSHPNCVTIHDFGFYQGTPYIVMEYLEGEPLINLMYDRPQGPLSLSESVEILMQICDALTAARLLKVVHRDLKPENIFMLRESLGSVTLKVLDFGIAKLAHSHPEASSSHLTRNDMIFGTPHYMSPEQINNRPIDHRSDLYALTVLFYEMLTGRLPYDSKDPKNHVEVLSQHLRDPIPVITSSDVDSSIAPLLEPINAMIQRGMAKDVNQRISTAEDFKEQVQSFIQEPPEPSKDFLSHSEIRITPHSTPYPSQARNHSPEPSFSLDALSSLAPPDPSHTVPISPSKRSLSHLQDMRTPIISLDALNTKNYQTQDPSYSRRHKHIKSSSSSREWLKALRGFILIVSIALLGVLALTYPSSPLAQPERRSSYPQALQNLIHTLDQWMRPLYPSKSTQVKPLQK